MYNKIKNYKSLMSKKKRMRVWHFDPQKKSKDAKYLGRIKLTKKMVDGAKMSVEKTPLIPGVQLYKKDLIKRGYQNTEIAWNKMDNIQAGYNSTNTLLKQKYFFDKKSMPDWSRKILKMSKLENAYLVVHMNPPGSTNPWHYDTFAGMSKMKTDPKSKVKKKIMRVLLFVDDWHWGHFLQVGNQVVSNWKKGDIYSWKSDRYHLATNSGITKRYTIAITGYSKSFPNYRK